MLVQLKKFFVIFPSQEKCTTRTQLYSPTLVIYVHVYNICLLVYDVYNFAPGGLIRRTIKFLLYYYDIWL